MNDTPHSQLFAFFNEVGIIAQLSRTLLEQKLPKGLLAPHFHVLNHLTRVQDGQTPQKLAEAFQVPKTSMTHTLAGLERAGLVAVRPNPADGRSKQVWLTDAGSRLREETIAALAPDFADLATRVQPEVLTRSVPDLTSVRIALDAQREES